MVLSLNEIRRRAIAFSHEWKGETREKAEAQTFWNEFFDIFGIKRRRIATFEKPAIKTDGGRGSIDLFWKGKMVVEHKSAEIKNLDKAYSQALDYFNGLTEDELPKYVIVTNFTRIRLYDLDTDEVNEFGIEALVNNINLFDFIPEHRRIVFQKEDVVNIKAAELMGKLHDSLKENGYRGRNLEILLVRLMFCLFADDTGIFEKGRFTYYIEHKTNIDGSNVGSNLMTIFETLNTSENKRQLNLDDDLNIFPYIDGSLFEVRIDTPSFDSETRNVLLKCCHFDWSGVSPAIFGSMFQSVMNTEERRDMGAHFTSEENIMKTINSLFLDDLKKEFNSHIRNKRYLQELLNRIGKIKILDPACGCGNFLIIAYRELRRLQISIHKQIRKLDGTSKQQVLDIGIFSKDLNVDSMYGIEILDFPARIAQVGLWLIDHLVNMELSKEFGLYFHRLPLRTSANIIQENALEFNWEKLVKKNELTCILGNPPYAGKKRRNINQNEDMKRVCGHINNFGILDYVSCWYVKATDFIKDTEIKVAFVSTNSITQGEQVGILGDYLLNEKEIKINFAHRTFRWTSQGRGRAQVFVVIIGFSNTEIKKKYLFDYENPDAVPVKTKVENINFYLIDQENIIIQNRSKTICNVPSISFGSMPNDDGNFLFSDSEKVEFLKEEPGAKHFIYPFISAKEFLNGKRRWCLWLKDVNFSDLSKLRMIKERVMRVREYRLKSKRDATKKLAETPSLFGEIRQPQSNYILIPLHSSENRKYIPMDFLTPKYIANNSCSVIENASFYHFGVLSSLMHMIWVNQICGRIKSDYRYSNKLVYNNYPWPEKPTKENIKRVEDCVKDIFNIRKEIGGTLSDLYHPLFMPKKLLNAHKRLDKSVDRCYSKKIFKGELDRLNFLFELYKDISGD